MNFPKRFIRNEFHQSSPKVNFDGKVQGLEHEYAIEFPNIENEDERDRYICEKISQLNTISSPAHNESIMLTGAYWRNLPNGGVIYCDLEHLEGSTPECLDTRELIKQDRATDFLALNIFDDRDLSPLIYKMNRDSRISFGAHQNFSTRFEPSELTLGPLLLWSVVEKIITGAGYQYPEGQFEISQRKNFIQRAFSLDTRAGVTGRGLMNTRNEPLTGLRGWYRFHHISNDANMCQSALAMKQELMQCVLALHENRLLPQIPYYAEKDCDFAITDLKNVCSQHQDWTLDGTPKEYMKATSVLRKYEEVMRTEFYGQDSFRNLVLDLFRDTIYKLERIKNDPYTLAGRLDWVTKKYLIERMAGADNLEFDSPLIQSINLDYHRIDEGGLFYQTLSDGWIEQHVSQRDAERGMVIPPKTRAETRGKLVQKYRDGIFKDGSRLWLYWDMALITDKNDREIWRRNLDDHRIPQNKIIEDLEGFLKFRKVI